MTPGPEATTGEADAYRRGWRDAAAAAGGPPPRDFAGMSMAEAHAWHCGYAVGRAEAGEAAEGSQVAPEPQTPPTAGKSANPCPLCGGQGWQYVGWARPGALLVCLACAGEGRV